MYRVCILFVVIVATAASCFAGPVGDLSSNSLSGWKAEGNAWGPSGMKRPGARGEFHAESLVKGEQATGVLRSESFVVSGNVLSFSANGWDGRAGGKGVNGYFLKSVDTGEALRSAVPPCNDSFSTIAWPVGDLKGQKVYFEAVDNDTGDAFAWLGLDDVKMLDLPNTSYRPMRLKSPGSWSVIEFNGAGAKVAPYLSSLANGEKASGSISSPEFTVDTDLITFDLCGHDGEHGDKKGNYVSLRDAATGKTLRLTYAPGSDKMVPCKWDVSDLRGKKVRFEAYDGLAEDTYAWMGINNLDAGASMKVAFKDKNMPSGWMARDASTSNYVSACGVPFMALPAGYSISRQDGEARLECGFSAKRIFLLGMINSWDCGNPCWAWPDYSSRLFIGEKAGDFAIDYADGSKDTIPMIFGYNLWWYGTYTGNGAVEPYRSDRTARAVLDDSLYIRPTGNGSGYAYFCQIRPRDKAIAAFRIIDNPKKKGAPAITAITFDTDAQNGVLQAPAAAMPPTPEEKNWIERHVISSDEIDMRAINKRLDALKRTIYTSMDDFVTGPAIDVPKGFRGPSVRFSGDPYADVLTNIYYHSVQDMDDKVDPDGVFHTSTKDAPSWGGYEGFGAWNPRVGSYYTHAWSRDLGRVLQELTELGYDSDSLSCAAWCNKQLMWFPEQFPRVNVEGKPTPGHWVRIINLPEMCQTPGMPPLFGNLENDGHGLIMLFQHKAWVSSGKKPEYVTANWKAVREAAEYICWLFDNPQISRAKEGVLFSESEGGGMTWSNYCDLPCYLGLTGYVQMAESAGKTEEAARWKTYAARMKKGISTYYPKQDPKYGDVWDSGKTSSWPYAHGVLAPIIIWPDIFGYDLSGMPQEWTERNRNTLRMQLAKCDPEGASGIAMGYGQCFITEGAMLLDEMKSAEKCLQWLARYTYCKGYKPYIVPEGCEIDETRTLWHRTGDLGNAVQEGEGAKCCRLVLGIDDNDPSVTRFVPRMPQGWKAIETSGYPVMVIEGGQVAKRKLDFRMKRTNQGYRVDMKSDAPLPKCEIRMGPYSPGTKQVKLVVDGREMTFDTFRSGDSSWAWIRGLEGVKELQVADQ